MGSKEEQNPAMNAAVPRVVKYMTLKTLFCKYESWRLYIIQLILRFSPCFSDYPNYIFRKRCYDSKMLEYHN